MIKSFIEYLSPDKIIGWCHDPDSPSTRHRIQVVWGDRVIGSATASNYRKDLENALGVGDIAFSFNFTPVPDPRELLVFAVNERNERQRLAVEGRIEIRNITQRGYQDFEDQIGDSDSPKKLACLDLPDSLEGKDVLDIGCNEGFFCIDALKKGATRVVGIDQNADVIDKARRRDNRAEYVNGSWWDIPNDKFDFIYFLSALHYENNPRGLFDKLLSHLKPGGKLVLECGVDMGNPEKKWLEVERFDGAYRYPTRSLLIDDLLRKYVVKYRGTSVMQSGDSVPRHVFHCEAKKPTVIFINALPGFGKSHISNILGTSPLVTVLNEDYFVGDILSSPIYSNDLRELIVKIRKQCASKRIVEFLSTLDDSEQELLADLAFRSLPLTDDLIVLDGNVLSNPESIIYKKLYSLLRAEGIHIWQMRKV